LKISKSGLVKIKIQKLAPVVPSLITRVVIAIAQSVRLTLVISGSQRAKRNCWMCRMCTLFSRFHTNSPRSLFRTRKSSMTFCSVPVRQLFRDRCRSQAPRCRNRLMSVLHHPHAHCVIPALAVCRRIANIGFIPFLAGASPAYLRGCICPAPRRGPDQTSAWPRRRIA
jgi:hypothetical protein